MRRTIFMADAARVIHELETICLAFTPFRPIANDKKKRRSQNGWTPSQRKVIEIAFERNKNKLEKHRNVLDFNHRKKIEFVSELSVGNKWPGQCECIRAAILKVIPHRFAYDQIVCAVVQCPSLCIEDNDFLDGNLWLPLHQFDKSPTPRSHGKSQRKITFLNETFITTTTWIVWRIRPARTCMCVCVRCATICNCMHDCVRFCESAMAYVGSVVALRDHCSGQLPLPHVYSSIQDSFYSVLRSTWVFHEFLRGMAEELISPFWINTKNLCAHVHCCAAFANSQHFDTNPMA